MFDKTISRLIPLIGAVVVGAYAYFDTAHQVGNTAVELFSSDIEIEVMGVKTT